MQSDIHSSVFSCEKGNREGRDLGIDISIPLLTIGIAKQKQKAEDHLRATLLQRFHMNLLTSDEISEGVDEDQRGPCPSVGRGSGVKN